MPKVAVVASSIHDGVAGNLLVSPLRRELIERKLRAASINGDFSGISDRDWRCAPSVFWTGTADPLGANMGVVSKFLAYFRRTRNRIAARALIFSYFEGFKVDSPSTMESAAAIREFLTLEIPGFATWKSRSNDYHLFEPYQAPRLVALAILSADDSIGDIYAATGVGRENVWGSFGRRALNEALATLAVVFRDRDERSIAFLFRMRAWLELKSPLHSFSIEMKQHVAKTLLTPWDAADPTPPLLGALKQFILDMLGDPRGSEYVWQGKELAGVRRICLRWFVGETIELFFSVIDKSADPWHWRDRKQFWGEYHRSGAIAEAWVAFGPKVLTEARRVRDSEQGGNFRFGELRDPNDKFHSVLFVRIRGLVIADYSHSGSCRFYFEDNAKTPTFYDDAYYDPAVRAYASNTIAHHQNWQLRFASQIYEQTGVRPRLARESTMRP